MAFEDALADLIRRGIETPHPHAGPVGSGVFAGSFDWHSSVHAHWALACMGRTLGCPERRAFVSDRLPDTTIEAERDFLRDHPSFERPYGRAWLALLLAELRRTREDVEPVLEATKAATRAWLETAPFPDGDAGALVATHESWLFTFFLLLLASPEDADALRRLLTSRVLPHQERIQHQRYRDEDFVDLSALLATIRLVLDEPGVESDFGFELDPADPEPEDGSGHACGREALELWPAAVAAARGDTAAAARFEAGMRRIEARPARWRGDFARVSHWVPQFLWMGLWLRAGRP